MSEQPPYPVYRRRQEASKYLRDRFGLNYGPSTLAKFATVGGGPRFVHAGRFPLYPEAELDAWALSRISPLKASTSDSGSVDPATVHEKLSTQDGDEQNRPPPSGHVSASQLRARERAEQRDGDCHPAGALDAGEPR